MSGFVVLIEGERPKYHFVNYYVLNALAMLAFDVPLRCAPAKPFYSTEEVLELVSDTAAETAVFYTKEGSPLNVAIVSMPEETRLKHGIVLITVANGKRVGPAGDKHPDFAEEECLVMSSDLNRLVRTLQALYRQSEGRDV